MSVEEIVKVLEDGREIWIRKDVCEELERKARKEGKPLRSVCFST